MSQRPFCFFCGFALTIAACITPSGASTLIDFDSPPAGLTPNGSIEGSPVGASSQLSNQYLNLGAVFSTAGGEPYAALVNLTGQAPSGTNGVGAVSSGNTVDYGSPLDVTFFLPNTNTPAVTSSVSIQGDEFAIPGNVIFSAYDASGNLLSSNTSPDVDGGTYSISTAGIHEFQIYSTSATVALDNLTFGDLSPVPQTPTSGAPEPSAIWLLAPACAWAIRRRLARGNRTA